MKIHWHQNPLKSTVEVDDRDKERILLYIQNEYYSDILCDLDRDANAAMNLLNEWKRTVATAGIACGEDVRPNSSNGTERQTSMKQEYGIIGFQAVNASA